MKQRVVSYSRVIAVTLLVLLLPVLLVGQGEIRRGTLGGSGGVMGSDEGHMHVTISQTLSGRSSAERYARFGLWHQAQLPTYTTVVSLPFVEAPVGTQLQIPLTVDQISGFIEGERREYRALIRYNASVLEPATPDLDCKRVGDTCYLYLQGTTEVRVGAIADLGFIAKLGNDTATLLEVVEFNWTSGEELHRVERRDGFFRLLDVCREGDSVRLIHAAAVGARISVFPNPIRSHGTVTFTSVEEGPTTFRLVDVTGVEVASLGTISADRARQYRISLDPTALSSGSYTLVCQTPSDILTTRILITE